jgi:hypothetical protein
MAVNTIVNRRIPPNRTSSNGVALLGKNTSKHFSRRDTAKQVSKGILAVSVLLWPLLARAQGVPIAAVEGKLAPTWSVNLTGGYANAFQLILGDTFGAGPDVQDKLSVGVSNAFLNGDTVSIFGWSTTDTPTMIPNWQAGLLYKLPLLHRKNHSLTLTAGGQRWMLPLVATGTNDWFVTGNLTYGTSVKRIPVFVSEDTYSLLKSNLPTGDALYSQVYTQQRFLNHHGFSLGLREGPAYTYSWGLYGASGSRVVRYGGAFISSWKGTTLESGYRKQFGLQDGIPNNGYWSFLLTKQLSGTFHRQ